LFRQLHADGTTLIVVTHDPGVAALGEREVALAHGRVVGDTLGDRPPSAGLPAPSPVLAGV
jgi:ABC-type lipoprotein export system ATPase subunit